jgi:hypothetical protein
VSEFAAQIEVLLAGSLTLAMARYLQDAGRKQRKRVKAWVDADVEAWTARSPDDIAAEATHRLEVLDSWQTDVQEHEPDTWETRRIDAVHARMNLQSARSGSFATAAGSFADFLRDAGEQPETLDLH